MHICIVRRPILAVGVGPIAPLIVAAVESNPARVTRLAFADERNINAVGLCGGGASTPSVVVGSIGIGRRKISGIEKLEGVSSIVGAVKGAALRIDLVHQSIDHRGICGMETHVPDFATDRGIPVLATVQRAPQTIVGRDIDNL